MHAYSTNSPANPKLIAYLMIVATALATGLSYALAQVNAAIGLTLGGVSAMTIFAGLFVLFDRVLWRWRYVRRVLLVPDLNGTWECQGLTLFKGGTEKNFPWTATVEIRQSWSRLTVALATDQSRSRSIAASLYQEPGSGYRLIYHYDNKPAAGEAVLRRHSGLCDLLFTEAGESADGSYFTDQDRMTVGTMHLKRRESHAKTGPA